MNKNVFLILFVLTLICYAQTYYYPFVYDDVRVLQSPSAEVLLKRSFSPNRSIVNFSFYLNKVILGEEPGGFRIINILIHFINGLLVFWLLSSILRIKRNIEEATFSNMLVPLLGSCIFIVHPLSIQSVTYLSQRFNSLAALFFLVTVLFFILGRERNSKSFLIISLVSSLLAFLSKEFTVSLIVIIPLCELLFFYRKENKSESVFLMAPFFLTGLTIPVLHFLPVWFPSSDSVSASVLPSWAPLDEISRSNYLITQIDAVFSYYLQLFFMPLKLSVYPSVELVRTFKAFELIAICLFSFIILGALNFIKKFPLASFGVLWLVMTLAPTSSFIPNTELVAEHRFYIPSIGILLIFLEVSFHSKGPAFAIILTLFVLVLIPLNYVRNHAWSTEEALWFDAVEKAPLKVRPYVNLAGVYLDQGKNKRAFGLAKLALNIDPNDPKALCIAGRSLEVSDPKRAIAFYQKILLTYKKTRKPIEYYRAQIGLAIILYNAKAYTKSLKFLLHVYHKGLLQSECHKLLAYNYYATNEMKKAHFHFKKGADLGAEFHLEFIKIMLVDRHSKK